MIEELLKHAQKERDEPPLLKKQRSYAQKTLASTTLSYRHLDLTQALAYSYEQVSSQDSTCFLQGLINPQGKNSTLVFINGFLRADLSSFNLFKDAVLLPFTKASRSYAPLFETHHTLFQKNLKDPLALINLSSYVEGYFLYVPPLQIFEKPLQIIHMSITGQEPLLICPRLHLILGNQSSLTVIETHVHNCKKACLENNFLSVDVGTDASLTHVVSGTWGSSSSFFSHIQTSVRANGTFSSSCLLKGPLCKLSQQVILQERGASCHLSGAWLGTYQDQVLVKVGVEHKAPYTRSTQLFKGIVSDKSCSSFEGNVLLLPSAQHSDARQLNQNMIISPNARAYSLPSLDVHADDVKATHGSTTGQFHEDAFWYLRARGMPELEAKKMLLQGFLREVTENTHLPELPWSTL